MIKIFRRIRQSYLFENKTGKYLTYAFGEIILVVIGILIALQLNNWNENRKIKTFEKDLLIGLQTQLIGDFGLINRSIEGNKRVQTSSQIILDHMDQDLPYHDSLALHFETTNIWWKMLIKKTA